MNKLDADWRAWYLAMLERDRKVRVVVACVADEVIEDIMRAELAEHRAAVNARAARHDAADCPDQRP